MALTRSTVKVNAWTRTSYQGRAVDALTLQIILVANALLRLAKFGGEREGVTMVQGSFNRGGVSASAGTHDGGATFDLTAFNWKNRVKVLRLLGVAYFNRPTLWQRVKNSMRLVWTNHGHGVVCGMGNASPLALSQVQDYYAGRNGLANRGRDIDWRPLVFPLAVFGGNTGHRVTKRGCHAYEQPTTRAKVERDVYEGAKVTVLMEVNVGGRRWAVTSVGDFIDSVNLVDA